MTIWLFFSFFFFKGMTQLSRILNVSTSSQSKILCPAGVRTRSFPVTTFRESKFLCLGQVRGYIFRKVASIFDLDLYFRWENRLRWWESKWFIRYIEEVYWKLSLFYQQVLKWVVTLSKIFVQLNDFPN